MPRAVGSPVADALTSEALTPDEALTVRFGQDLRAVWPEIDAEHAPRLGVAVSGGPDSMALLLLVAATLPGRVEAATVDHRLRADNAREAADVARLCAALQVPHETLAVTVEAGNVQDAARQARYAALGDWARERGLGAVATAHHADDQAETLLMRLNRASGVAGLAGVRPRGRLADAPALLLRPVLAWRRAELAGIVAAAGVTAAEDPSNADDRFDRARLRKAMREVDWLDVAAIAQSAAHLAEADAAVAWTADLEYGARVKRDPFGLTYRPMAPRAVALRVIARIVTELDAEPRGSAVARLFDTLTMGEPASIGNLVARPNAGGWSFAKAPARKAAPKRG